MLISINSSYAQCIPEDESTCPDIENNGEICPDTLPDLTQGTFYSESITILPPPEIEIIPGNPIPLHHIQIMNIDNLPPGLTWVSNDTANVFLTGTYYCVLLEGTPSDTGTFFLKIIVDAYIPGIGGSDPIYIGTTVDSTSVSLTVNENTAIPEYIFTNLNFISTIPNPFSDITEIKFNIKENSEVEFVVYNLMGEQIFREIIFASSGENFIKYNGSNIPKGLYLFSVSSETSRFTGTFVKIE